MDVEIFSYSPATGWSVPSLPALDSPRTLVLAFGARERDEDPAPLRQLVAAYPQSQVLGCSTAGEIFDASILDGSFSVAVCRFAHTELHTTWAAVPGADRSADAGREIAAALKRPDLRGVLVISDGINVNGSELLKGVNSELPADVVVTGGLAGDGSRFQRTWVLRNGEMASNWVSAVGFYGDRVSIGHGSKGGWDIFGPERRVTRASRNVLFEIDGRPALDLYKSYLGELAAGLPASALLFPLSLRRSATAEDRVVRTILAVDEAEKSMTFAGDIPEGSLVQLMRANFDRLIDGAFEAARLTGSQPAAGGAAGASLTIAISCVGRRLVLGQRAEEEVEAVLDTLPDPAKLVGFYSYGEISPYATGRCELHNQTMTLTRLAER